MYRFLAAIIILFAPLLSFAQTDVDQLIPEGIDFTNMVMVASVNLFNGDIVSQGNNEFQVTFDIYNGEGVQPDVRYVVQLLEEGDAGALTLIDSSSYEEVLFLEEDSTITKSVAYKALSQLNGSYKLRVVSSNSNGLEFGRYTIGSVTLNGDNQGLKIDHNTCSVSVEGVDGEYALDQGVDIDADEVLILTCVVTNNTTSDITLNQEFTTLHRTAFGEEVETIAVETRPLSRITIFQ